MTYWSIKGKYSVQHTLAEQKFSIHTLLSLETALLRVYYRHNFNPIQPHRSCCRCLLFQMKLGNVIKGRVKHSECIMHTPGEISGKNSVKPVRSWSQNTCAQFENIYSYSLFLTIQS